MHRLLLFVFLLSASGLRAQNDTVYPTYANWVPLWTAPIDADCTWDVDQAGNVYLFNRQTVSKLDSTGRQLLTQSVKSIGTITKIDATNWLKIAVFSEDQQQICYLDNALALQPTKIDLAEVGVNLAQQFATSAQTDRIWVFDQLNSELQLITIRTNQRQIIQNLKSLADIGNVLQMVEFGNALYILGDNGTVTKFDNFGTLTESYELPGIYMQPFEKGLLLADAGAIRFTDTDTFETTDFFDLYPGGAIIRHFSFVANRLYVSTDSTFYCFRVR